MLIDRRLAWLRRNIVAESPRIAERAHRGSSSAAFGLVTKSVEAASNAALPLQFLPLGSAIVPTDSMPSVMRVFADNQPSRRSSRRCAGC
jgi:hypothetical protein